MKGGEKMKAKKLVVGVLVGTMLIAVPLFARGGGQGKGYMGGTNSNFVQGSGQQLFNGYGDGTQPRPMDGTGLGAKGSNGQGLHLQDGSCFNPANQIQ